MNMEVINSNFNIFFSPILNLRESIFNLENELASFFPKPFGLIPLPNEAPLEIPRITATSHHGYSNLNISLNSAQFSTKFDENFSNDWNKCSDYIYQHVSKIYSILKARFNDKPLYCGLTINFLHKIDSSNAIDLMINNFIKNKSSIRPYDIVNKNTYVIEDNYYLNLQIQNQRLEKDQNFFIGHLSDFEKLNLLAVSLDINDRYGFNYIPGYFSGFNKIDRIFQLTNEYVIKKLENFIIEGEFVL